MKKDDTLIIVCWGQRYLVKYSHATEQGLWASSYIASFSGDKSKWMQPTKSEGMFPFKDITSVKVVTGKKNKL